MSPMSTIHLLRPLARARVLDAAPEVGCALPTGNNGRPERGCTAHPARPDEAGERHLPPDDGRARPQQQEAELARLLTTVNRLADSLGRLQQETLAGHHRQIARLAVEIARKILMYKVGKGDYAIQAIVEEALRQAPTRQQVVVHLHPEDLPGCQRLQREDPHSPFAEVALVADGSLGHGECLVETPKGIVRSFIEEHLERIREALETCEV